MLDLEIKIVARFARVWNQCYGEQLYGVVVEGRKRTAANGSTCSGVQVQVFCQHVYPLHGA